MNSLKNQFLKAGLTNKQSVINKPKKKQATLKKKDRGAKSESSISAEQNMQSKMIRDKELNKLRQQEYENKAVFAQIKQLVEFSKIDKDEGELAYNFTFNKKIKTIYINSEQQLQLTRNQISIVTLGADSFELVPRLVAEKIILRDKKYIILNHTASEVVEGDDPYADYQIPDDLTW